MNKNAYTREDLLLAGTGQLLGADSARLPLPPMLMFDRIASITSDGGPHGLGQIVAELDITPDLWFFECHFESRPRDAGLPGPGCHVAAGRLLSLLAGRPAAAGPWASVRSSSPVRSCPRTGSSPTHDLKRVIMRRLVWASPMRRWPWTAGCIYTATDLKVGLFTSTDYF